MLLYLILFVFKLIFFNSVINIGIIFEKYNIGVFIILGELIWFGLEVIVKDKDKREKRVCDVRYYWIYGVIILGKLN